MIFGSGKRKQYLQICNNVCLVVIFNAFAGSFWHRKTNKTDQWIQKIDLLKKLEFVTIRIKLFKIKDTFLISHTKIFNSYPHSYTY